MYNTIKKYLNITLVVQSLALRKQNDNEIFSLNKPNLYKLIAKCIFIDNLLSFEKKIKELTLKIYYFFCDILIKSSI